MSARLEGVRVCILRTGPIDHDKRTQQVARLLTATGAEVTVVSATMVNRVRTMEPGGFKVREVAPLPASENRIRAVRVASNLLRNRVRTYLRYRSLVRAVRETRPDVVHCMNVDMLLVGYRAVGARRFIYDSREHFATTGYPPRRTRLWWVMKERFLTPRAAAVITVTDMIADDLARRYRIERPTAIVNGCTTYVPEAKPVHEPLRLLHQGRFYFDRHLDDVIDAVVQHAGKAVVTLQGWGDAEESLRRHVRAAGAEGVVRFEAPCPPNDVVQCAAAHDVGIINIWPENDSHKWTGSNKLFDYMGAGLAELVTNLDFTRSVVEAEGCGIVFDPPTADALSASIQYLVDNPEEVARMKRNAVKAAAKYSWDSQAPVLYEVYERALDRARTR